MKRKIIKRTVEQLQRKMALLDYKLGIGPKKTSKTYYDAYARYYAEGEGVAYYDYAQF